MKTEDKIAAIDRLLQDFRGAKDYPYALEYQTWLALKEIHRDLRAATPGAANQVLDALDFQINSAMKAKARLGYIDTGHHQAIAECTLSHWPVIRHALEKIEEKV